LQWSSDVPEGQDLSWSMLSLAEVSAGSQGLTMQLLSCTLGWHSSLSLEKTSKIMKSSHQTITTMPALNHVVKCHIIF